ncbi:MAG: nucleotide exchange factor GrpE [Herpetosiphonaceae bacterium]|nr:nucleotide exchange factor GrpE [Herpetosiphonaceae bacterium]
MAVFSLFRPIQRWLAGHAGPATPQSPQDGSSQEVLQRLVAIEQQLGALPQAEGLDATLAALEKQLGRVGREQLKANALVQTQADRWAEALEALQSADQRRDADIVRLREQAQRGQAQTRLELIQAILPAIDGLDEAVRAGETLLAQPVVPAAPSFWERLRGDHPVPPEPLRETMGAWIAGIRLVRQRLLDVLAADGIQPISAQGQRFDPYQHSAIGVVPSDSGCPPGTVASELRRGYQQGERIVRLAEVVVAKQMHA